MEGRLLCYMMDLIVFLYTVQTIFFLNGNIRFVSHFIDCLKIKE
jgi:hypothetical protein